MSLYLLQPRVFRLKQGQPAAFPAVVRVSLTLGPDDAFGLPAERRAVVARARPARLVWNANEGTGLWEAELIEAISWHSQLDPFDVRFEGNEMTLTYGAPGLEEAQRIAGNCMIWITPLLSLWLRVHVWIKEAVLTVGEAEYRAEMAAFRAHVVTATRGNTERRLEEALKAWREAPQSRRLASALYYYRQALRWQELQPWDGSTLSEIVMNLAKAIQVLFGDTRDTVRDGLRTVGLDATYVEGKIVPLLLIRNEFDIAHPSLSPLASEQEETLRHFIDQAVIAVEKTLRAVIEGVRDRTLELAPEGDALDRDKERLLNRIEAYVATPP